MQLGSYCAPKKVGSNIARRTHPAFALPALARTRTCGQMQSDRGPDLQLVPTAAWAATPQARVLELPDAALFGVPFWAVTQFRTREKVRCLSAQAGDLAPPRSIGADLPWMHLRRSHIARSLWRRPAKWRRPLIDRATLSSPCWAGSGPSQVETPRAGTSGIARQSVAQGKDVHPAWNGGPAQGGNELAALHALLQEQDTPLR